jgi:ABC-2 type transport system ATP-binding protein
MSDGPMIEVQDLTKRYGRHAAVSDVSFVVERGEVVGLLGPNGAGKSTTIRVLACFIPATSGTARVGGLDVFTQADDVRRRIGYMPENNPLHLDMRTKEYLRFRAHLKGLGGARARDRVDSVMEQCGLTDVSRRIIGTLSKGFRQRVGLADALVHEPDLIVLDEPTIGLDPHQIRAFRQLIKDLSPKHTVLLSSHILPEVEMTCHRVLILHDGKIVAADSTDSLRKRMSDSGQVVAEIAAPPQDLRVCWEEMENIEHYDIAPIDGDYCRCALTPRRGVDLRPMIFVKVMLNRWKLRELSRTRPSLEDIFVRLTRAERDEEEGF